VADQPLLSVETDKAVVEVPAPYSGRIAKLHGEAGDVVKVGSILVEYEEGEASDSGAIVGEIPKEEETVETGPKDEKLSGAGPKKPLPKHKPHPGHKALPAVRELAKSLGVDLAKATPSGPEGNITKQDVEAAAAGQGESTYEPLRGVRKAMVKHMEKAHREVVPAGVSDEADVDAWIKEGDPTVRLVRAIVAGCKSEPGMNAWFQKEGRRLFKEVNLGIAVDTKEGLFVPVLREAGSLAAKEVRQKIDELVAGIQDRSLPPELLHGESISLSNFGAIGGRYGNMIVNPPQVAIVGAGRVYEKVVAVEGKPEIRHVMPMSLTFDHRAVTGGEAARFMKAIIQDLELDQ